MRLEDYIHVEHKVISDELINQIISEYDSSSDWKPGTINDYEVKKILHIKTNFDYRGIQTLYSNLSSLDILQLYELRDNYKRLNYSLTEVNLQIMKIFTYPLYLLLITIFSALIMFRIKRLGGTTYKISLGLFLSVVIYYINNFFLVMGNTERISLFIALFTPLLMLGLVNSFMLYRINEK